MLAPLQDVSGKCFDYVIAGGGTAGLVVAARLSEDPNVSVVVLEAGDANLGDPLLLTPGTTKQQFGNKQYDWGHLTIEQKLVQGRSFPWSRGKGLGGSSGMNLMVWHKPPKEEIDDIERLGNPGWNWENYQKYSHKVERFIDPSAQNKEKFHLSSHEGDVGRDGKITLSYPITINDLALHIDETFKNAGLKPAPRPYGGNTTGYYHSIHCQDPTTATRSYAATGYYLPNKDRKNFVVLTRAVVNKVITESGPDCKLNTTGVEFVHGQAVHVVHARKEILELSGIGSRDVLEKVGITIKVDLPGVGANLQEHYIGHFGFRLKDSYDFLTFDCLHDPEGLAQHMELYKQKTGLFTTGVVNFLYMPLESISPNAEEIYRKAKASIDKLDPQTTAPGLLDQYKIQLERLDPGKNGVGSSFEVIGVPGLFDGVPEKGRKYVTFSCGINNAFSRGTIHIRSNDPLVEPEMDPKYFDQEADRDVFLEFMKWLRRLPSEAAPMKDMIECEVTPGPDVKTEEELLESVMKSYTTTWHTCGTCSMLPRDKNGVVDHMLKVYGTNNLRVVDLSVVPLHFAAHTQATVYAIAEQAADIIKGNLA